MSWHKVLAWEVSDIPPRVGGRVRVLLNTEGTPYNFGQTYDLVTQRWNMVNAAPGTEATIMLVRANKFIDVQFDGWPDFVQTRSYTGTGVNAWGWRLSEGTYEVIS